MGSGGRILAALALAALAFGWGGQPARAAAPPPPTLKVEVIGLGSVAGLGISCGLGSLSCYATYGADPQSVALTATPGSGWTFGHWEDSGAPCAGTSTNPCTASVTGAVTITAVFVPPAGVVQTSTFGVSLPATPGGSVTDGSTNYPINCPASSCSLSTYTGSTITVVEQPDSTHFFSGWGGSCSGTSVACATYLGGDRTVSASFVASTTNQLSVTVTGNGSVSGGGISCGPGSTCDAQEPPNSNVTLTASPANGYTLTSWGGACSGTQTTCTVQMDTARSVTAAFAPLVQLSVTVTGSGFVTGGGIGCDAGQTCTAGEAPGTTVILVATPASGGSALWSGCTATTSTTCSVTIGTNPVAVTASLTGGSPPPISTNSLNITVKGDGYVIATAGSAVIYCTAAGGSGCSATVPSNTSLTLSAIPASGTAADFTHWLGDCSAFTSTSCSLTMTASRTVEADFAGGNTTYLLGAQVVGNGTISGAGLRCSPTGGSCSAQQAASATVTLTATPGVGSTFTGWGGACTGTSSTCTVSMTLARSVTATFATGGSTSTLALTVRPGGSVAFPGGRCVGTPTKTITCKAELATGEKATLRAQPAAGFGFVRWTGACAGQRAACELTPTSSVVAGAVFERLALAPHGPATVVKIAGGDRVTLPYISRVSGTLTVTVKRGSATVGSKTGAAAVGAHRITLVVAGTGRYTFTLSVGAHAIRWRVTIR